LLNNGDELHARSLHAAPALIPLKLLKHAKIIKEFLATQSAFDEIFGPNGAVNQLDAILATVGVPDCHYRFWSDELLDSLKLTAADFGRMVLGDVGGVLIAKPGINDEQQALLKKIQGCWLGVRMEHLQRCCRVGKPGVIVLAIGPMRAKVVLYTLLHRLVNHLIVDRSLARTLIRLMDDVERVGALAALK
jgi:DNA-binding transcriptional regulator LsrR (DeoR family)